MGHGSDITFFTSTRLLAELTDILTRPKFAKKIAGSLLTADQLVDLYAELAAFVRPVSLPRLAPDPDDDVVIGTAIAARASFIVTGDRSLRSVAEYDGGRIVSVREALHSILLGKKT
jgi:uncharacterized protein